MQEMGRDIIPLIPLPEIQVQDVDSTQHLQEIQSYVYTKTADYEPRKIFSIFWDQFY
jgi:hypothetical protein